MSKPSHPLFKIKSFLILTLASLCLFSNSAWSIKDPAGVEQERETIRQEIQKLTTEIDNTQSDRERTSVQIQLIENQLKQSQLRLQALQQTQLAQQTEIQSLEQKKSNALKQLKETEQRLKDVIRNQHLRTHQNATQEWLSGQSPSSAAREQWWLEKIFQAEQKLSQTQQAQAKQLDQINAELTQQQTQLNKTVNELKQQERELNEQRNEQVMLIDQLNNTLENQTQKKSRLIADETRLTQVIIDLKKLIEQERKRQQERKSNPTPAKINTEESKIDLSTQNSTEFAHLKGQLSLPTEGTIVGRFGEKREKDTGQSTWKGIFIKASNGTPVYAVGSGRIIFAEWLRGFGEIIIIDHGDHYLSVYGNNATLLNSAGDFVKLGDKIAEVGNSSGTLSTGLYFELRHQGKPFNPLLWVTHTNR